MIGMPQKAKWNKTKQNETKLVKSSGLHTEYFDPLMGSELFRSEWNWDKWWWRGDSTDFKGLELLQLHHQMEFNVSLIGKQCHCHILGPIDTCVCMCAYVRACVCVCVCVYIYMYIYIYMRKNKWKSE